MSELAWVSSVDAGPQRRTWKWWLLKLLFSGVLVGYLFYSGKISLSAFQAFSSWRGVVLAATAALLIFLAQAIAAVRLFALFKAQALDITLPVCLKTNLLGLFANNYLPTSMGGDAVRGYYLVRGRTGQMSAILATLVYDRLLGLLALAFLALLAQGLVWKWSLGSALSPGYYWGFGLLTGVILSASLVLGLTRWPRCKEVFRSCLTKIPLASVVQQFLSNLAVFTRHGKVSGFCLGLSLFPHLLCSLSLYLVSQALGLDAGWGLTMVLSPLIFLTGILPISPGNLGWTEYLGSLLWSSQGLADGGSLWMAYRMVTVLVSLTGLIAYWRLKSEAASRES